MTNWGTEILIVRNKTEIYILRQNLDLSASSYLICMVHLLSCYSA